MNKCSLCDRKIWEKLLCKYHYAQKWRKNNRDKIKGYQKKYRLTHKEKVRELWNRNHKNTNAERLRKYRKTKRGTEATRKAIKKYESTHPERRNAWNKAQSIKMQPCKICGKFPAHRHHPDLNRPLEVIFLCPLHHKQAHQMVYN